MVGVLLLAVITIAIVASPFLSLPSPTQNDLRSRLAPPSLDLAKPVPHVLGTDQLGRDILSRMLQGGRVTVAVAASAVILGGVIGVALGLIAGYFGGIVDRVIMRIAEAQIAIPLILLALLLVAVLGPNIRNLVVVLALTGWIRFARIVRTQVMVLREQDFVQSAFAIGAGTARILTRHILPNVMTPLLVVATLELARIIVLEASLSFLGLGIQPPSPSWGRMLSEGRPYMTTAWWIVTFPGLAILMTVLGVNFVGDWLRDYFDPRLRNS
jgi:peptide/nickel transport system permease protein